MKLTFLGTGTSNGIPMLACNCPVCTSQDPRNNRLRASVLLESGEHNLLIDASSDFRQQGLKFNIQNISDILITHIHADHVFGLDEMRRYNQLYKKDIQLYLKGDFDQEIREVFKYIYYPPLQLGGGVSKILNHVVSPGASFRINDFEITPLNIFHGILPILGYRINDVAYLTDCSKIPEETYPLLKNLKVLVLGALRDTTHPTHFSLAEAVAEAKLIGADQTYFTHISHNLEHVQTNESLPKNIQLAYDGLSLEI